MNSVSLIGRLTAAPELKHTQNGTAYSRFSIAVDRPAKQSEEKQTDFINCIAWGKQAEFICKYFGKGQRIGLTGSIRTGSYTANDGSKRYTTDILINTAEFCENKAENANTASYQPASTTPNPAPNPAPMPEQTIYVDESDLPF